MNPESLFSFCGRLDKMIKIGDNKTMKPIRIAMFGKPKLYKPFGAKFLIRITKDFNLEFVPKIEVNKKTGESKIIEYVFNGVDWMFAPRKKQKRIQ